MCGKIYVSKTRIRGTKMKIPTTKAACLSHLLMLVSTGYRCWTRGEMHYSKSAGFAKKLADLYPIEATSDMRSWAKKTGRYAAFLIMFPHDKDSTKVMFWLLATPGKAPKGYVDIHSREKLSDAVMTPLSWRDQYECVRIEKAGRGSAWTWRMKKDYYSRLEASAKEAADSGSPALKQLFGWLRRMPMFGGIRTQITALDQVAKVTWKKQRKSEYPDPLRPEGADGDSVKWLPVMSKITVWGDLTLDILVQRLAVAEQQQAEAGATEADVLIEGFEP